MRLDITPKNADCIKRAFDIIKIPGNIVINIFTHSFITKLSGLLTKSNAFLMQSALLGTISNFKLKFGSRNLED